MGVIRRSKKVSSFEMYKLNPLSPHCDCAGACALLYLGSSANCYSSRQHSRPAQLTFFVDHTHAQFTEESNIATALTPQTDVTSGEAYRK